VDRWLNGPPAAPPAIVSIGAIVTAFFKIAMRPAPAVESASQKAPRSHPNGTHDRGDVDAIKERFDLSAFATQRFPGEIQKEPDGQLRVLGNGGLIIDPRRNLWYRFDGEIGGDCFDLVGVTRYSDAWDRHNATMFREALQEAAQFANVNLADYRRASVPPQAPTPIRDFGDMPPAPPAPEPSTVEPPPKREKSDLGNAERLVDRHGDDLKFVVDRGLWAFYDRTCWRVDDTGEVYRRMMRTVRDMLREASETDSPQERNDLAKHALKSEAEARINAAVSLAEKHDGVPIHITDFDRDPWLLNCLNGTLELKAAGGLREHRRGDLLSKRTNVAYDPTAQCPTWLAYLEKVMNGNQNVITFLQRAIGYSLTALTAEQVFFILYGNGSNGKTTFLEVLRALLGAYGQNADFRTFTERKNDNSATSDIARMVGARLITSAEVRDGARLSESLIKSLTGGDMITARFLYRDEFDFPPTHKLWLSVNHRPIIKGTDTAIWRRPLLVPFVVTIGDDEKDIHLLDKLKTELPGILAWAVEGCHEWQEKGLAVPAEVRMATEDYRKDMDVLASFFEDYCTFERNAWAPASALYITYKEWCEVSGERYETSTAFGRRLTERDLVQQKVGGKRGWLGIALKGTPLQSNLDTLDTLDTNSEKSHKGNLREKLPKNALNLSNVSNNDEEGGVV
jgi:putative DNA primase/helicase